MAGRVGWGGGTRSVRPAPRGRHAVDNGGNTDMNTRLWEPWKLRVKKKDANFGVTHPPTPRHPLPKPPLPKIHHPPPSAIFAEQFILHL